MREISPAENASVAEFLNMAPPHVRAIAERIREQKRSSSRPIPSKNLTGNSKILNSEFREELLDHVAKLVDENLFGRSEMCQQFAMLVSKALNKLGFYAKVLRGVAKYPSGFSWEHYWVETKEEIIDANVDILYENPAVPQDIAINPFWGKKLELPTDRKLRAKNKKIPPDTDVEKIWWPELKQWIKQYNNANPADAKKRRG